MTTHIKYPRTYHLPWSEGLSSDDRLVETLDNFKNKNIIITEKLDGENTTIYNDHLHARSLSSNHHPSRSWVKMFHERVKHDIPQNIRICGENVYAKHSIFYDSLPSYFLAFSVWNNNVCLSWTETVEMCELLGISIVPILYQGIWSEEEVKKCWTGISKYGPEQEGYVVRLADSFLFDDFNTSVVKFVRKNHVTTSEHWLQEEVFPNELHKGLIAW